MNYNCTVCTPNGPDLKLGSYKLIKRFGIIGLLYYWYKVSNYLGKNNFDVVWLHNPLLLRSLRLDNSVITIHTTYYGYKANELKPKFYFRVASLIEKYCFNKIKNKGFFTVVSNGIYGDLVSIGVSRQKISVIENGVDIKLFQPSNNKKQLRKRFNLPQDDKIILSLGRLTDQKQPTKLIDAFCLVKKESNDVTLAIAGTGELLEKVKELVRWRNIKGVIFLGYVDYTKDAPSLYACSDYFILASKYEGQPLTLFEAMASGLPCIVSNISSLQIVDEVKCGIVVDYNNLESASTNILNYLDKDNNEDSRRGRKYTVENLSWELVTKKYLNEFEKIVSENLIAKDNKK